MTGHNDHNLIAYSLGVPNEARLARAPRWRDWMNDAEHRWPNRCLPLLMANEAGWVLLNAHGFVATWNGEISADSVRVDFDERDVNQPRPESHFGYGILTWTVPYLFRTPPGWNLLVRGPANWPKDGICPLEGLVETDWSVATFTMNWKLTRPNCPVRFDVDEPFCMIVPTRRGELRSFTPEVRDVRSDAEVQAGTESYANSRHELSVRKFLAQYARAFQDDRLAWQQHYFRGVTPDGRPASEHETGLHLADFMDARAR
jgi:hypothetical protein